MAGDELGHRAPPAKPGDGPWGLVLFLALVAIAPVVASFAMDG